VTSPPQSPPDKDQNIAAGIGLMLFAIFMFSANDVLGKWLAGTYSAPQILLFRSMAAMVVLVPMLARSGGIGQLFTVKRPRLQLLRALLGAIEVAFFYWAVKYLPLADAMTYYLAGPIYVTVIAALFLGEKVGWWRWAAVVIGFAGVVIALGPSIGSLGPATLIAFAGSLIYAVFLSTSRVLRGTPDIVLAAYQMIASMVIGVVGTPFAWTPLRHWSDGLLLGLLGLVSLVGIVTLTRSLKLAPASVVVPYQYSIIVWAVIFGFVVFGDIPRPATLAGAAIIIGAGLFIFFREQKAGRKDAEAMPGPE
jgi:drug/metabolite transporter (DMT)-like permease